MFTHTLPGRSARTILLLHGGGVGGWMWQPLIEYLGDEWTYLVPDLPGHGQSADQDYPGHDDTVELLAQLLEREASEPVTVVGFSLGAQLAVLLASRHPRLIQRAVIVSAQAIPSRWPEPMLALLGLAAPLARNERFARAQARELFVPDSLLPSYLDTSRTISRATLLRSVGDNLRFTPPPAWRAFPGEALIMVGAHEQRVMRASARLLAEARAGKSGALAETVQGCGHGIPFQRPEWLAARLRRG